MARERTPGKIVFVSSFLGYMSIIGYSSYSPGKHALRGDTKSPLPSYYSILSTWAGLAETLRSELLLYSTSVHIFFPGTMFTPGYIQENTTKPKITLKIEETDSGLTAEQAAEGLFRGM
jgi:3-dehydrosphinganine reductase